MVDDGSTDQTYQKLKLLENQHPGRFCVLRLKQNSGKASAVRYGMLQAVSDDCFDRPAFALGYWDADLSTPLETIDQFSQQLLLCPDLQIVTGARVKLLGRRVSRRNLRHYLGRVFATLASLTLTLPVYDTQCGAKLFRNTPVVHRLFDEPFYTRWAFDVEILARLLCGGGNARRAFVESIIYEYPLMTWVDVAGSKVRAIDFIRELWSLFRIRRKYFSKKRKVYIEPGVFDSPHFRCLPTALREKEIQLHG